MSKSLVIFDLYNTLIIDEHYDEKKKYRINSIWSTLEKIGLPIRFSDIIKAYDKATDYMYLHQQDNFSASLFDIVNIFAKELNILDIPTIKKCYDIWSYATLQFPPKLVNHVKESLEELKKNKKKIALISNTGLTPGITLRFILKEYGIYDLFDDLVFSDEFGFMKPKSMIFERILERFNVDASDACFIGDHEFYDKFGATSVGIDYIYISPELDFKNVIDQFLINKNSL